MNDTTTQLVQPPPHDVPVHAYNAWAVTGAFLYIGFFAVAAGGLALWHEVRCLRRASESLLARIVEVRSALGGKDRP
jgi:hypothetical protein